MTAHFSTHAARAAKNSGGAGGEIFVRRDCCGRVRRRTICLHCAWKIVILRAITASCSRASTVMRLPAIVEATTTG
ncbi:MAG TPA: hypothetical protein VF666_09445 [Pyrinomonadaceae bacterium]